MFGATLLLGWGAFGPVAPVVAEVPVTDGEWSGFMVPPMAAAAEPAAVVDTAPPVPAPTSRTKPSREPEPTPATKAPTPTTTKPPPAPVTTAKPKPAPVTKAPPPPPPPAPKPKPPPPPRSSCSTKLDGTVRHVAQAGHHVAGATGFSGAIGGRAGRGGRSDHPSGHALDFIVGGDRATGDRIAAYALAHREELGITYVIWYQRINHGKGWQPMDDRGDATANHKDHPHLSFSRTPPPTAPTC